MLFRAVAYLAVSVLALRLLGVRRALSWLDRKPSGDGTKVECSKRHAAEICTAAVERAARATGMGTCLSKSLALGALLSSRGIDSSLCIGVNRLSGGIAAHAWVETGGAATGKAGNGAAYDVVFPDAASSLPAE